MPAGSNPLPAGWRSWSRAGMTPRSRCRVAPRRPRWTRSSRVSTFGARRRPSGRWGERRWRRRSPISLRWAPCRARRTCSSGSRTISIRRVAWSSARASRRRPPNTTSRCSGGDVTRAPVLWVAITVVGHADSAEQLVTPRRRPSRRPAGGHRRARRRGGRPPAPRAPRARGRPSRTRSPIACGAASSSRVRARRRSCSSRRGGEGDDRPERRPRWRRRHLAAASGVGLAIELERLPLQAGGRRGGGRRGVDAHDLAAGRGRGLRAAGRAAARARRRASAEVAATGSTLTRIGTVEEGRGCAARCRRLESRAGRLRSASAADAESAFGGAEPRAGAPPRSREYETSARRLTWPIRSLNRISRATASALTLVVA